MTASIRDIRRKATYDIWRVITNRDGGNRNDPRVVFERVDLLAGYVDVVVGAWYFRLTPRYTPANGARVDVTTSTRSTADIEHTFTKFSTIVSDVVGDADTQFRDIIARIVPELAKYARHSTCVARHFCDDVGEAIGECSASKLNGYRKASETFPFPSLRDGDARLTYADAPTVNDVAGLSIGDSIVVGGDTVTRVDLDGFGNVRNRISDYREGSVAAYKVEHGNTRVHDSFAFVVSGASYGTCGTNSDADAILDIIDADPRTEVIEYCVSRDDIRFEIPEYGTFRVARNSDHEYEFHVYYEESGACFYCGIGEEEWFDRCEDDGEDADDVFAEKIADVVERSIALADGNTFSVLSTRNRYNHERTETTFDVSSDYSKIHAECGQYDFSDVYADVEHWDEWKRITFPPNRKCWDEARVIGQQPGDDERPVVVTFELRYTSDGGETYHPVDVVEVRCYKQ